MGSWWGGWAQGGGGRVRGECVLLGEGGCWGQGGDTRCRVWGRGASTGLLRMGFQPPALNTETLLVTQVWRH